MVQLRASFGVASGLQRQVDVSLAVFYITLGNCFVFDIKPKRIFKSIAFIKVLRGV